MSTQEPLAPFYQHLGHLFYAVAASDKVVRNAEIETMQALVLSKWVPLGEASDEFDTDLGYHIEIVFEWLKHNATDADDSFQRFANYAEEHPDEFTPKRRQMIWQTANDIADAFSGTNKSELIMLSKLRLVLNKIA
ncbi:hypothetical protein [Gilvibacter sediminis]|uniref:hypothetical protein n=1 Tax=Gilvibacter sediminis TaxID=379071 RepID=UPI0023500A24|nr:hypothetical protein [Gilvibacter sediminis]MDC7997471.1 hypothetical protein [Gilvibacter sediminis]